MVKSTLIFRQIKRYDDFILCQLQISMNRLETIKEHIENKKYTKISIYRRDNVGYISMKSSEDLNILSVGMTNELLDSLTYFSQDSSVYIIAIVSEVNKIFCTGSDLKKHLSTEYEQMMKQQPFDSLQDTMNNIKKPIITAVNGKAIGQGFLLALMSDIVFASEKSYFCFPELQFGYIPSFSASYRLTNLVKDKKAMRHILSGKGFSAQEAFKLNIAEKIPSQNFDEEVQKGIEKIGSKALSSLVITKKTIKQSLRTTLEKGLEYEKAMIYPIMNTSAVKEGVDAFLNKRKPNFKGL